MLQFQGVEVLLELPHMYEVCCELGIVATALPSDLLNDQLRISLRHGFCQAKDQSLVLCHVVGGLELKVHHVLQLISVWVDEDHTSSGALLADGPVEEECPVGLGEDWCPDFRLRGPALRSGPWLPGPAHPYPPRQVLGPPAVLGSHWDEVPPDPLVWGPDLQTEVRLTGPHVWGPAHPPWLGRPWCPPGELAPSSRRPAPC